MDNLQVIRELMVDIDSASKGMSTKYAQADLEGKLREQIVELFGKANPTIMEIKRNPNGGAFFTLMEEFVGNRNASMLAERFPYARVVNVAWGDAMTFEIENADLFDTVTIASGNFEVRRQRLENGFVTIPTKAYGIKIFENFKRFLSGKVNWTAMITKVSESYMKHVQELIMTALYNSTPVNSNAVFNVNDAGGFAIQSVIDMEDHVQAENQGMEIVIMGTRQALRKLAPVIATDEANREMHQTGFYTTSEGYKLLPIDQMHVKNTFTFLLSNKELLIVPMDAANGLVTVVQEGTPLIMESQIGDNKDGSVDYMMYTETGVGIATGRRYGKYTWV